jgi:DNA-directed RNA polymerase specialized sigma24 family protein
VRAVENISSPATGPFERRRCCIKDRRAVHDSTRPFSINTRFRIGYSRLGPLQTERRPSVAAPDLFREKRALTQLAFRRLLEWLDDGVESQGETYLEMRRRLVSYFDRRNRVDADELADETFNRIAHTLAQGDVIGTKPPARYCYVVARFVLLEGFRRDRKYVRVEGRCDGDVPRTTRITLVPIHDQQDVNEQRLDCLDRCLDGLRPDQRELAIDYYRDVRRQRIERRRDLARRLGITTNALAIRACRLRDALMTCVEACRGAQRKV